MVEQVEQPGLTLVDLLPAYETALRSEGRRPRGVVHYLWAIGAFIGWAGQSVTPDQVTPDMAERYRDSRVERGCKPGTVKCHMAAVRCFFRWCLRKGYSRVDPMADMTYARVPKPLPRSLQKQELRALTKALVMPDDLSDFYAFTWRRNRLLIYLMLYTGVRLAEAEALRWREVDMEGQTITVLDGKGGKSRQIPLHPALVGELEAVPVERRGAKRYVMQKYSGERLTRRGMDNVFRSWLPRLGVEGVHAHRLRHTFATTLVNSGVGIERVSKLMGHESIETTVRYLLLAEDGDRAAIRGMPYLE